jgi:hypothetical protein
MNGSTDVILPLLVPLPLAWKDLHLYKLGIHGFISDGLVVAEVQVFNLALFDGVLCPINHSVVISSSANSSLYVLELVFLGGFNDLLYYNPSLGLGVLLGSDRGSGSGGNMNVGLIVGVTMGVGVTLLLMSGVIMVSITITWWRKKQTNHSGGVNWGTLGDGHMFWLCPIKVAIEGGECGLWGRGPLVWWLSLFVRLNFGVLIGCARNLV